MKPRTYFDHNACKHDAIPFDVLDFDTGIDTGMDVREEFFESTEELLAKVRELIRGLE